MTKPISKQEYHRFNTSRKFNGGAHARYLTSYSAGFIKVFHECRGLITREQADLIRKLGKKDEQDARNYIETELIIGMGDEE